MNLDLLYIYIYMYIHMIHMYISICVRAGICELHDRTAVFSGAPGGSQ